ncbi:MAG: thioredoxin domain-containing protein [Desulfobacula sp.]|nr:thioredoxin domain-containing protein [Desulfobacula sp.]
MSDRYKDQLKFVIKHFPLESHKFARIASQASLAAHKQGKFWEFHEKLFENYDAINDDKIEQIAIELKLDMDKFNADINLPEIQLIIDRDIKNGKEIGILGTPTIFINGKQINPRTFDDFIIKIESELKKNSDKLLLD